MASRFGVVLHRPNGTAVLASALWTGDRTGHPATRAEMIELAAAFTY
jgi:hypothetical protein